MCIVEFKETKKSKMDEFKQTVKNGFVEAGKIAHEIEIFVTENPRTSALIGSALYFGVKTLNDNSKQRSRAKRDRIAMEREYLTIYDHSMGKRHMLKRRMTQAEDIEFARRRANGERTAYILGDMGLLKY